MSRNDGLDAVREHRDDLKALAESDLQCAKYAAALLEIVEDLDTGARG
ncbi:hypothetical protein [Haloferax sp. YSMS24]